MYSCVRRLIDHRRIFEKKIALHALHVNGLCEKARDGRKACTSGAVSLSQYRHARCVHGVPSYRHRLDAKNFAKIFRISITSNH
jgi:hypothetical protein